MDNLLVYLTQHKFTYDIIAVTETWLKEGETATLPGYTVASMPRPSSSRGGGVALFIKNEIDFDILPKNSVSTPSAETIFVQIKRGIAVGVVYRPPSSAVNEFICAMEYLMTSLITSQVPVVACGDFNINLLKDRSDYLFLLESLNLKNVISTATRVTDQSESIIDHMLCHAEWEVLGFMT